MSRRVAVLLGALALAAAVPACDDDAETALRVSLSFDETWGLDELELVVDKSRDTGPVARELYVRVPDDRDGRDITLAIWGKRAGQPIAHAEVRAQVRAGATVEVDAVMARLACGAWCTPGERSCRPGGVSVCEERDDGCMEWSEPVACPSETPFCSLGACANTCVDECVAGETHCAGPDGVLACGQVDGDDCLDWLVEASCPDGQVCSNGECDAVCANECTPGDAHCLGGGVSTCGDLNADGCAEWGPMASCPDGQSCSGGTCDTACVDECDEATCVGDVLSECGQYDLDECLDFSPGTSCAPAEPCMVGSCSESGCERAPRVCDDPPATECLDDDTLRVFDAVGTCSDDVCGYAFRDIDCPSCPDCDACADVVCDDPPSECFQAAGTCEAGACSYPPDDAATCDDGNACTDDDVCDGGVCAGVPRVCDAPPAPECVTSTTLRTYVLPGGCTGGACSYAFADTSCIAGCAAGACANPRRVDLVRVGSTATMVGLSDGSAFGMLVAWTSESASTMGNLAGFRFADVDGDGDADLVRALSDQTIVRRSDGTGGFGARVVWASFGASSLSSARGIHLADVDGDGLADFVKVADDAVLVALSDGTAFGAPAPWLEDSFTSMASLVSTHVADVDGDGRADFVRVLASGTVVARSSGSSFGDYESWSSLGDTMLSTLEGYQVRDVTGDGRADLVVADGDLVRVAASDGDRFGDPTLWSDEAAGDLTALHYGDANGDGLADLIVGADDGTYVRRNTGTSFGAREMWSTESFSTGSDLASMHVADVGR